MSQQLQVFEDSLYPTTIKEGPHLHGEVECVVRQGGKRGLRTFRGADGKPFQVWVPNGKVEAVFSGDNIAVNRIKTQLAHMVVGHETTTRFANKMVWGTGGHAVGDPRTPIAPLATDTSLESQILTKNFATFEFPTSTSVRMIAFILEAEANGFTITEEGIVAADSTLIARRTFPGLPKTEDFVFEFRHSLLF